MFRQRLGTEPEVKGQDPTLTMGVTIVTNNEEPGVSVQEEDPKEDSGGKEDNESELELFLKPEAMIDIENNHPRFEEVSTPKGTKGVPRTMSVEPSYFKSGKTNMSNENSRFVSDSTTKVDVILKTSQLIIERVCENSGPKNDNENNVLGVTPMRGNVHTRLGVSSVRGSSRPIHGTHVNATPGIKSRYSWWKCFKS